MDTVRLQLLAIAKSMQAQLQEIANWVREIHKQNEAASRRQIEAAQRHQHSQVTVPVARAVTHSIPPFIYEEKSYQRDNRTRERSRDRVEKITLGVLAVYTLFTVGIYWSAKKSADAANSAAETAKDSLIANNRPWVGIDPDQPITANPLYIVEETLPNHAEAGIATKAHVWCALRNYGNSAAVRIAPPEFRAIITSEFNPPENWNQVQCVHGERESQGRLGTVSLMPKVPMEIHTDFMSQSEKPTTLRHIWLIGCIVYQDPFGGPIHHTRVVLHSEYIRRSETQRPESNFALMESDAD
jgi:hypothetical protein